MIRKIKYEEEVGEISSLRMEGTFDEVIEHLKEMKKIFQERFPGEELVMEFDPFVEEVRDMKVYRRVWEK